jgi:hypothetical protein
MIYPTLYAPNQPRLELEPNDAAIWAALRDAPAGSYVGMIAADGLCLVRWWKP